jgi:pimeloyl-ACP methyl ester carboxylesterase/DNA-binding CsgD family transcriptional regulator
VPQVIPPPTAFLRDRHSKTIAYSVLGSGRPIVCDTGFVSHLEVQWSYPPYRRFFEALARSHQVVRFDLPGIGLGDPTGNVVELDDDVAVLEDLVDGLALKSVDLFGASQAAAVMIAYAARHPERVGKLVVYGGYAHGAALSPSEVQLAIIQLVRTHWGLASSALADVFIAGADDEARQFFVKATRAAASPESAERRMAECFRTDIRDVLASVRAPTLAMHRVDDHNVRIEHGQGLAAGVPGARFLPLDGRAHVWYVGDMESVLNPTLEFLGDRFRVRAERHHLSARERQVAALVSLGLSNAEIASRLGIVERTAEAHVEHIRDKLDFSSRAQIAAWAVKHLAGEVPR